MNILNVYVDETGNFGFGKDTSDLYGLSFVFYEQNNNISKEIKNLNERLNKIKYKGMIHTAELISKRNEYSNYSLDNRRKIFNYLFQFAKKIPVKYHSIIIDKRYCNNERQLKDKISSEIQKFIQENKKYINKFDKIVLYYDNGQEPIKVILREIFKDFKNFEHKSKFDKVKERLFQVADMLIYIDKYDYKYKHTRKFSKNEKYFLTSKQYKIIIKDLDKKRL